MTTPFHYQRRPAFNVRTPDNPSRRVFLNYDGAVIGGTLVDACGGDSDDAVVSIAITSTAPMQVDPIWGPNGPTTTIISSLKSVAQSAFLAVDFQVGAYGMRPCSVAAQISPYTDPTRSPVSSDAGTTQAPDVFGSCPVFLAAIIAFSAAGGGRVVVPSGTWYCAGLIVLQSNVNFHLSVSYTVYLSANPADYVKDGLIDRGTNGKLFYSRWQTDDCLNYGSPTCACNASNIALMGGDTALVFNGRAMTPFVGIGNTSACRWISKGTNSAYSRASSSTPSRAYSSPNNVDLQIAAPGTPNVPYAQLTDLTTSRQRGQNYLPAPSGTGVPVEKRIFGLGHYLRPCTVEFIGCTNVLMESYRIVNTPFRQHHPVHYMNVVVHGVTADSIDSSNDSFDPDACSGALLENVTLNTGDDCTITESGKSLDTSYGPMQDHVIQNCTMSSGHGGIILGSEMGGGMQSIYVHNLAIFNQFWATNLLNIAIRAGANMNRGGFVKSFYVANVNLPNGVNFMGAGHGNKVLAGSLVNGTVPLGVVTPNAANLSASQGGVTISNCDYQPTTDAIRTWPALVQNVNISNVIAGNIAADGPTGLCFQTIAAQGLMAFDYNGLLSVLTISPITGAMVSSCNFGTPTTTGPTSTTIPGPLYAYNMHDITLQNMVVAGQIFDTTVTNVR